MLAATALPTRAAPPALRGGEWQVLSNTVGQPAVSYHLCMKNGGAEDLKLLLPRVKSSATCPAPELREEGNAFVWELACPAAALSIHARYTVQPAQVQGKVEIVSGNPPQRRVDEISANYVGACATR